ncbi:hypothetical protein BDK51DRAFT_45266 [Blyttiomyces helicus]|uniref:Uncharacterized protein n=1 Tax=Blyttiomyces helicus TaxID=388810 RepID=A0A4P9VVM5_9FUNG|nr:hypothetical protein BDK51DRAFT_45266 [Blyttiomyces helicus]|eukprot:RKO83182.1 hypothetical protein BDK51DRAFT_45266 [Blyttiomyces helicus]
MCMHTFSPRHPTHPDSADLEASISQSTYNSTACRSCGFNISTCPITATLCPTVSDLRLDVDPSLSCSSEIYPYYVPGATLVFLAITIGIPAMYFRMVQIATRAIHHIPESMAGGMLQTHGARVKAADASGNGLRWRFWMGITGVSSKGLFSPFSYRW